MLRWTTTGPVGAVYDKAVNEGKKAREGFTKLFKLAAKEMARRDQPRGCMLSLSLPTCSPKYDELQRELDRIRMISETIWINRFQAAVQSKEIPKSTNLRLLSAFFRTTLHGMTLQARAGASQSLLLEVGKLALQDWRSAPHVKA